MSLRVSSGGGSPVLGGAGSVLDLYDYLALGMVLQPGNNTGWTDGSFSRYGAPVTTLGGANVFAAGSAGATPNRGFQPFNGLMWRRARNTVATNIPIDWYCGVRPHPTIVIPPVDLARPFAAWDVAVTLMLDQTPAVPITKDCGLVFTLSAVTAYPNHLRAGVSAGNDYAGFGVVFNGTNGELLWICKKNGAAGGAALTEQVSLGVYGALRPIPVRVRFVSAFPGSEARLDVAIDNVVVLTRRWGTGTVLPVVADATFQAVLGFYSPMVRAAQEFGALSGLLFNDFHIRCAASETLLG